MLKCKADIWFVEINVIGGNTCSMLQSSGQDAHVTNDH